MEQVMLRLGAWGLGLVGVWGIGHVCIYIGVLCRSNMEKTVGELGLGGTSHRSSFTSHVA